VDFSVESSCRYDEVCGEFAAMIDGNRQTCPLQRGRQKTEGSHEAYHFDLFGGHASQRALPSAYEVTVANLSEIWYRFFLC
jgi:hypothetical protein